MMRMVVLNHLIAHQWKLVLAVQGVVSAKFMALNKDFLLVLLEKFGYG